MAVCFAVTLCAADDVRSLFAFRSDAAMCSEQPRLWRHALLGQCEQFCYNAITCSELTILWQYALLSHCVQLTILWQHALLAQCAQLCSKLAAALPSLQLHLHSTCTCCRHTLLSATCSDNSDHYVPPYCSSSHASMLLYVQSPLFFQCIAEVEATEEQEQHTSQVHLPSASCYSTLLADETLDNEVAVPTCTCEEQEASQQVLQPHVVLPQWRASVQHEVAEQRAVPNFEREAARQRKRPWRDTTTMNVPSYSSSQPATSMEHAQVRRVLCNVGSTRILRHEAGSSAQHALQHEEQVAPSHVQQRPTASDSDDEGSLHQEVRRQLREGRLLAELLFQSQEGEGQDLNVDPEEPQLHTSHLPIHSAEASLQQEFRHARHEGWLLAQLLFQGEAAEVLQAEGVNVEPQLPQRHTFRLAMDATEALMSGALTVPLFRLRPRSPCAHCGALLFQHEKK